MPVLASRDGRLHLKVFPVSKFDLGTATTTSRLVGCTQLSRSAAGALPFLCVVCVAAQVLVALIACATFILGADASAGRLLIRWGVLPLEQQDYTSASYSFLFAASWFAVSLLIFLPLAALGWAGTIVVRDSGELSIVSRTSLLYHAACLLVGGLAAAAATTMAFDLLAATNNQLGFVFALGGLAAASYLIVQARAVLILSGR